MSFIVFGSSGLIVSLHYVQHLPDSFFNPGSVKSALVNKFLLCAMLNEIVGDAKPGDPGIIPVVIHEFKDGRPEAPL